MRLLFASDLHGSTTVFRKAQAQAQKHRVDMLVLGGDLQGKYVVPVLLDTSEVEWEDPVTGSKRRGPRASIDEALKRIASVGGYGLPISRNDHAILLNDTFAGTVRARLARERLASWVSELGLFARLTGITTMLNPGNDDDPEFDTILHANPDILCCDGRVIEACGLEFAGIAYVPPTPWNTPREKPEDEIRHYLDAIIPPKKLRTVPLVLCAHCPPFASALDVAPLLDERLMPLVLSGAAQSTAVGSKAVREFLETRGDVLLSLHGHIHEADGFTHIGRTLCLNPGSEYGRGILQYFVVEIVGNEVKDFFQVFA